MSAPRPLLLALDTSTSTASVALFDGQRVLSETTWLAGREHSTRLLIEVELAFERVGRARTELSGIVVAVGPGSFTGVRVALSVAKGIAAGLSLRVWGVGSLAVVAYAAGRVELPVRPVLEAGRGRYATTLYHGEHCVEPARLATLDQLTELLDRPTLVIGELDTAARAGLEQTPNARVVTPAASLRRASLLAELGWRLAEAGDPGDPRALDAVYVN